MLSFMPCETSCQIEVNDSCEHFILQFSQHGVTADGLQLFKQKSADGGCEFCLFYVHYNAIRIQEITDPKHDIVEK